MCEEAWRLAFSVSGGKFRNCLDRLKAGHTSVQHGNAGSKWQTLKSTQASGWMKQKFNRIGDHMPDCDKVILKITVGA